MEVFMEKKTIGAFIAALRKANGMTQQELADRLNISNKAVSRWEREECAPDLSLIPALAEIFGVTCDELLKGERIFAEPGLEKSEPKVEKQLKALIHRAISSFKTLIWISLALSVVGLICMYGISYGFYRPIIGFAVMMLFEVAACVISVIGVNKARDMKTNNELFEEADESLAAKFDHTLGSYSFVAFWAAAATVLLSLFPVLMTPKYFETELLHGYFISFGNHFIPIRNYFINFISLSGLLLVFAFLSFKALYIEWLSSGRFPKKAVKPSFRHVRKMNCIQLIFTALAILLFLLFPYFFITEPNNYTIYHIALCAPVACLLANIISYIVFLIKYKNERKLLIFPGIRNVLLILPALHSELVHDVSWGFTNGVLSDRYDNWSIGVILEGLWAIVVIYLIFAIIEKIRDAKKRNN